MKISTNIHGLFFASALALLVACSGSHVPGKGTLEAQNQVQFEQQGERLYFGRNMAGGGEVTEQEWAVFLEEVVTPLFPDGLTHWQGMGQWRDGSGQLVLEQTFILELFPPQGNETNLALGKVMAEYARRFRQQSVLRLSFPVRVQFYEPTR